MGDRIFSALWGPAAALTVLDRDRKSLVTSPISTRPQRGAGQTQPAFPVGPLSPRAWDSNLGIDIAGIRFALTGLPAPLARGLQNRFRLFVGPGALSSSPNLTIRVRPAVVKAYLDFEKQEGPPIYRLETRAHEGRLHVWSYAFAGWFDISGTGGEINLCESPVEPPERSIENFLRVALAWKASRAGGLLLHASGVVRKGLAYIFFGPSGSGKTTITRLSPRDILLNDDCILVSRENGAFVARGVPFKGSEAGGAQHTGAFPIAGLFRLVKARQVFCEKMSAVRAVAEITASVPFVTESPEGLENCVSTIENLARSVRVGRLHFRLAPDFWDTLEEGWNG